MGLAIAHKVVNAHGGSIWCESSKSEEFPRGKVEFFFTLPASDQSCPLSTLSMPESTSQISQEVLGLASSDEAINHSIDQSELDLELKILATGQEMGRSLRVLIVDDEDVYRQSLATSLSRTPELSNGLVVRIAAGSKQALGLLQKSSYDLVICDVDMGADSLNGFGLVKTLRSLKGATPLVVIHSNRICASDSRTAVAAGADTFLSKPSTRSQLLKLILQAQQRVAGGVQEQSPCTAHANRPEIMIVEDGPFQAEAFEDALKADATVHLVASPEALGALLLADPGILDRLTCAIIDMHYDGSSQSGLDVAATVKKKRAGLKVLLSSDGDYSGTRFDGLIDHVIGKEPISLASLRAEFGVN